MRVRKNHNHNYTYQIDKLNQYMIDHEYHKFRVQKCHKFKKEINNTN